LAVGLALAAVFILVWVNLAVGVIGSEDNPANLMHGGVLAIGFLGAIIAELRPQGMARTLFAMALAQALIAVIALIFGLGAPWNGPGQILALNGFFVTLFVGSALLFRSAAWELTPAGAGPEGEAGPVDEHQRQSVRAPGPWPPARWRHRRAGRYVRG
jgi:hypothetical protein